MKLRITAPRGLRWVPPVSSADIKFEDVRTVIDASVSAIVTGKNRPDYSVHL